MPKCDPHAETRTRESSRALLRRVHGVPKPHLALATVASQFDPRARARDAFLAPPARGFQRTSRAGAHLTGRCAIRQLHQDTSTWRTKRLESPQTSVLTMTARQENLLTDWKVSEPTSVDNTAGNLLQRQLAAVGQADASSEVGLTSEVCPRRSDRLQLAKILGRSGRCNRSHEANRLYAGGVPSHR